MDGAEGDFFGTVAAAADGVPSASGSGGAEEVAEEIERLKAELGSLTSEAVRLRNEGLQLRSALRRARPAAAIVSALHAASLLGRGAGAGDGGAGGEAAGSPTTGSSRSEREARRPSLEEEASALMAKLRELYSPKAASTASGLPDSGHAVMAESSQRLTVRQVRLARECAELRHWLAELESSCAKPQAVEARVLAAVGGADADSRVAGVVAASPFLDIRTSRHEMRRLQQLELMTERLHEEVRRTPRCGSTFSSPVPPGSVASERSAATGASAALSRKSVELERHLDLFCKRFALRQGILGKGVAVAS